MYVCLFVFTSSCRYVLVSGTMYYVHVGASNVIVMFLWYVFINFCAQWDVRVSVIVCGISCIFFFYFVWETFLWFNCLKRKQSIRSNPRTFLASPLSLQAFPSPSNARSVACLGKQLWRRMLLSVLAITSLFSSALFLSHFSFSSVSHCSKYKSFQAAVLVAKPLWDPWHPKPFEIQPNVMPPRPIHEVKWIKMAGPSCTVSLRPCQASFWGLGGSGIR